MLRLGAGAVLSLLALSAEATQQPSPPKVETFSTAANLVLVDFVVTDNSDRAVAGLAAKDFVVKEDGKERPIVSFVAFGGDALQVPEAMASASPESWAARGTRPSRTVVRGFGRGEVARGRPYARFGRGSDSGTTHASHERGHDVGRRGHRYRARGADDARAGGGEAAEPEGPRIRRRSADPR